MIIKESLQKTEHTLKQHWQTQRSQKIQEHPGEKVHFPSENTLVAVYTCTFYTTRKTRIPPKKRTLLQMQYKCTLKCSTLPESKKQCRLKSNILSHKEFQCTNRAHTLISIQSVVYTQNKCNIILTYKSVHSGIIENSSIALVYPMTTHPDSSNVVFCTQLSTITCRIEYCTFGLRIVFIHQHQCTLALCTSYRFGASIHLHNTNVFSLQDSVYACISIEPSSPSRLENKLLHLCVMYTVRKAWKHYLEAQTPIGMSRYGTASVSGSHGTELHCTTE